MNLNINVDPYAMDKSIFDKEFFMKHRKIRMASANLLLDLYVCEIMQAPNSPTSSHDT